MRADPQPDWYVSATRDGKLPPTPVETQWASGYAPAPQNRPKKIMKAVASFIGGATKFCCGELRAHRGPEISRDRPKRYRRPIIESQLDRLDKLRGFHAFTERRPEMSVELTPQIDDDIATVDAVVFVHERHAYHQQQN